MFGIDESVLFMGVSSIQGCPHNRHSIYTHVEASLIRHQFHYRGLSRGPDSCVLLLGVVEEQWEEGGEETVFDSREAGTCIASGDTHISRTVSEPLQTHKHTHTQTHTRDCQA